MKRDKLKIKDDKAQTRHIIASARAAQSPAAKELQKMVTSKTNAAKKVGGRMGLKGNKLNNFINEQLGLMYKTKKFKELQAKSDIKYTK